MLEARFEYGRGPRRNKAPFSLFAWLFPRVDTPRLPAWTGGGLITLMLCGLAFYSGSMAVTNDRGLVMKDVITITLSPAWATVLYWAGAALMALGALFLGYFTLGDAIVGIKETIDMTSESIIVPVSGWSGRELTIPYDDILEVSVCEKSNPIDCSPFRDMTIAYRAGTRTISSSMLPDEESFDTIYEMLIARMAAMAERDCQPQRPAESASDDDGDE